MCECAFLRFAGSLLCSFRCPEICPDYGICATCFIKKKGTEEIELFEAVQANPKLEKKHQIGAAIVTQKYYGIGLARLDWFQIDKGDEVIYVMFLTGFFAHKEYAIQFFFSGT